MTSLRQFAFVDGQPYGWRAIIASVIHATVVGATVIGAMVILANMAGSAIVRDSAGSEPTAGQVEAVDATAVNPTSPSIPRATSTPRSTSTPRATSEPLAPRLLNWDLPTPAESMAMRPLGLDRLLGPIERAPAPQSDQRLERDEADSGSGWDPGSGWESSNGGYDGDSRNSGGDSGLNSGGNSGGGQEAQLLASTAPAAIATSTGPWSGWLALSLLSLAPAALLMTTSYVRIAAVLGLLRHALGMPQLPSTTVISSLSLFMTFLVMAPVWTEVYEEAIVPGRDPERRMSWDEFWTKGSQPLRRFMSRQIDRADNSEDVWLFYRHLPESRTAPPPSTYDEVPLAALLPAFLVSELKIAFLIGFQICLPFLVVDLVVASMTTALGMMMVPTQAISLPLKLLLFVMLDGWRLVVSMLLESFQI